MRYRMDMEWNRKVAAPLSEMVESKLQIFGPPAIKKLDKGQKLRGHGNPWGPHQWIAQASVRRG